MLPIILKLYISQNKYLIEAGNIYAGLIPWFFSFFSKRKYSVYTYGTELIPLSKFSIKTIILSSVLNRASKIYTLLEGQKEILYPITMNKNIEVCSPKIEIKNRYSIKSINSKQPIQILSVGRLVSHKGHIFLLKAALSIKHNIKITIVGDGEEYLCIQKFIKDNSLSDKVTILNKISDTQLEEIYKKSDIFILPSIEISSGREGFGIAILEAMSYGIPVIGSDSGGISEVLGYGEYGILAKPADPVDLSNKINILIEDKQLYTQLSKKAFENMKKKYVW